MKALELAKRLENPDEYDDEAIDQATAELRRLAELNAELLLDMECFLLDHRNGLGPDPERLANTIAKAHEEATGRRAKDMRKDTSGPAFPSGNDVVLGDWRSSGHSGMSLRDYFAAKELIRMEYGQCMVNDVSSAYDRLAAHCYKMADAMLKARES